MTDPRSVVPESIMPAYPWLSTSKAADIGDIQKKLHVLKKLGHPYTDEQIRNSPKALQGLSQLDALIRYLQILGTRLSESPQ